MIVEDIKPWITYIICSKHCSPLHGIFVLFTRVYTYFAIAGTQSKQVKYQSSKVTRRMMQLPVVVLIYVMLNNLLTKSCVLLNWRKELIMSNWFIWWERRFLERSVYWRIWHWWQKGSKTCANLHQQNTEPCKQMSMKLWMRHVTSESKLHDWLV